MRSLVVSVALHAAVLWLVRPHRAVQAPPVVVEEPLTEIVLVEPPVVAPPPPVETPAAVSGRAGKSGGGGGHARGRVPVHADAWGDVAIGMDGNGNGNGNGNGSGIGNGNGSGNGSGNGFGFGDGGGIATTAAVPTPPAPPPPSKARPAKLLLPARDREVEDTDYLFVARVTVDPDGDVVAVRFVTTHPGLRGDQAASAIWSFRYAPALDDDGTPIRSTFEQPFQVR